MENALPIDPALATPGDCMLPFQLETGHFRGRLVRVTETLNDILSRHDYPAPVAALLGEALVLSALLAGMLKYNGTFTLQTKGDGIVPLLVADITNDGSLRGYAKVDAEKYAEAEKSGALARLNGREMLGQGYLAFTVDQGSSIERYQGIVELQGESLADAIRHYFRQSEQLQTGIAVAVGRDETGWRGGAIMVQRLPGEGGTAPAARDEMTADDWRRSMMFLATVSDAELIDPSITPHRLLFRLFHEEGVRVYDSKSLTRGCRCSQERVVSILQSLDPAALGEYATDGKVDMVCEFCNHTFWVGLDELSARA
jgi:molecular chaperone Hsp33